MRNIAIALFLLVLLLSVLAAVYFACETYRCLYGDLRFMRSSWLIAAMLGVLNLAVGLSIASMLWSMPHTM